MQQFMKARASKIFCRMNGISDKTNWPVVLWLLMQVQLRESKAVA